MPFLVIMDEWSIPFQGAEGKTVIFSSGEANRGTGRSSQAKKRGTQAGSGVNISHIIHYTRLKLSGRQQGPTPIHIFQVVRPLWEHNSRAELHLWGLRGVISRAGWTQLCFIGLVCPLKTTFLEAKSVLPRSSWSCGLLLCGSVPRVHPLLSLTWGSWCSLWVGKGTWQLSVNIMYIEMMGSAAKAKQLPFLKPLSLFLTWYRLRSNYLRFDKLGIHQQSRTCDHV